MEKKASRRTAREIDVHVGGWRLLGCQSDNGGGHRGKSKRRMVDENCPKKTCQGEMWDRSNLEMVVAVPWRKNENDPKMDGERRKSEVTVMDKTYKEKLEAEERVLVPKRPKRVYMSFENLEEFGFTARCPGCMALLSGDCETSAYGKLSKANRGGAEGHSQGTRGDEWKSTKTGRLRKEQSNKTNESRPGRRTATT